MKILIAGDTHANVAFARRVATTASDSGCEMVLQLGDFGYWPRFAAGVRFLAKVSDAAVSSGIPWMFCDGNHEDHESLAKLLPDADADGPVLVAPMVSWVPRGRVIALPATGRLTAEVRALFFGGAVSVDARDRTPGFDWFDSEVPSPGEWDAAFAAADVDLVVAHDVPDLMHIEYGPSPWPDDLLRASASFRSRLSDLAAEIEPSLWLAGHHHRRMSGVAGATRFEVLGCDSSYYVDAVAILETDTLTLSRVTYRI